MSIILEGIDLPKTEYEEVIIRIKHTGEVCDAQNIHLYAQAIQIPTPHGRLIDGDKIVKEYYSSPTYPNLCAILNNAPTIIEGEDE